MPDPASSTRSTTNTAGQAVAPTAAGAPSRVEDLAYSTFYGGAIGGSVIAILFLVLDAARGEPLTTPSLMGSVLFTGAEPTAVGAIRLDMVAYFSLVHLLAFMGVGAVASQLYLSVSALRGRSLALAAVIFALLTGALFVGDALFMSGVVGVLGLVPVLVANVITAVVMASFIAKALAHRVG